MFYDIIPLMSIEKQRVTFHLSVDDIKLLKSLAFFSGKFQSDILHEAIQLIAKTYPKEQTKQ